MENKAGIEKRRPIIYSLIVSAVYNGRTGFYLLSYWSFLPCLVFVSLTPACIKQTNTSIQKSVGAGTHTQPSLTSVPLSVDKNIKAVILKSTSASHGSSLTILGRFCRRKLFMSPPAMSSSKMKRGNVCRLTPMHCTIFWWLNLLKARSQHMEEKHSISTWPTSIHSHSTLIFDNLDWSKSSCGYKKNLQPYQNASLVMTAPRTGLCLALPMKIFNRRYEKLKAKQSLLSVRTEFNGHTDWKMRVTWEG